MATTTCPICKAEFETGAAVCPTCGFQLAGRTEAFQPIASADATPKPTSSVPVLKVLKGPYNGQEFTMSEGSFTIGRDPACDLFLNNMTVSRLHATIIIDGKSAKVKDEGSLNGTWVDGVIVEEAPLVSGSTLQIGTFEMSFMRKNA